MSAMQIDRLLDTIVKNGASDPKMTSIWSSGHWTISLKK